MKNEKILNAMGKISDDLIADADIPADKESHTTVWVKWAVMAACLCLVIGGFLLLKNSTPAPSLTGDSAPVIEPVFRGPTEGTIGNELTAPNHIASTNQNGGKINVYSIASLEVDTADMLTKLQAAGWAKAECTLSGEYSFFLKGALGETHNELTEEMCKELAKAFMVDSGLDAHLGEYGVFDCEYKFSTADGLAVTYCYFLCGGERTGAYIRFVFEGYKHIGEIQAHIYASECIDNLTVLSLDDALKTAYKMNSDGKLEKINADEFRVQNVKLVYVNGLPYYKFAGFGRNTRMYIDGFALAVNIAESSVQAQLLEQHTAFKFE